jgi:hypothetical protein
MSNGLWLNISELNLQSTIAIESQSFGSHRYELGGPRWTGLRLEPHLSFALILLSSSFDPQNVNPATAVQMSLRLLHRQIPLESTRKPRPCAPRPRRHTSPFLSQILFHFDFTFGPRTSYKSAPRPLLCHRDKEKGEGEGSGYRTFLMAFISPFTTFAPSQITSRALSTQVAPVRDSIGL